MIWLPSLLRSKPVLTEEEGREFAVQLGLNPDMPGVLLPPSPDMPAPLVREGFHTVLRRDDARPATTGLFDFPPCIFGFEPWCWTKNLFPPSIAYKVAPVRFENVAFHLLHLRIDGDVVSEFVNNSTPGAEVEVNKRTGAHRDEQPIQGSADISGAWDEIVKARDAADEVISSLSKSVDVTPPDITKEVTGTFEKSGFKSIITTLLGIFKAQTVSANCDMHVTVRYNWLGEEKVIEESFPLFVVAPVNGLDWEFF